VTRTPQPEFEWIPLDQLKDVVKPMIPEPKLPIPFEPRDLAIARESFVKMQSGQDWLVNSATVLRFDGEVIGATGRAALAVLPTTELAGAIAEGGMLLNAQAGSDLASGSTVVALASDALAQAGLAQGASVLNVVGSSGFNATLAQNVNALKRSGFGAGNGRGGLIRR
jgi:hypothetical protein